MPPSVDMLMSSKKMPHSVGAIAWPGWFTATEIFAGCALADRAADSAAAASQFFKGKFAKCIKFRGCFKDIGE